MTKVLDAGHRERQALLAYWKKMNVPTPFWKFLEEVEHDPQTDFFSMPDGTSISVQDCNQLKEK